MINRVFSAIKPILRVLKALVLLLTLSPNKIFDMSIIIFRKFITDQLILDNVIDQKMMQCKVFLIHIPFAQIFSYKPIYVYKYI